MQRPKVIGRNTLILTALLFALVLLCRVYLRWGLAEVDADTAALIVNELRLPRMVCALGVGALLSVAGAVMQGLFRNPLVEPYTMGISGGAVVGVAAAFVSGLVAACGGMAVTLGALFGGLATMFIIMVLRRAVGYDVGVMLICGIMVSFVASAATTVMLSLATREDISQILAWTIGTFESADANMSWLALCFGVGAVVLSPLLGNVLNVMSLGESEAVSLGVNATAVSGLLFAFATFLTAIAVSSAGVVAFVGMVVPHLMRTVVGQDHRVMLPFAGVAGAVLMLLCDFLAKSLVSPRELPAGAICAVLGGLMFVYMTIKWKRQTSA